MIVGSTQVQASTAAVGNGTGYVMPVSLGYQGYASSIAAALDGNGPGSGAPYNQELIGVIYSAGALVTSSEVIVVPQGQAQAWVTFPFDGPPLLSPGTYDVGVLGGPVAQIAEIAAGAANHNGLTYTDTFADGPAATLPSTSAAPDFSIFLNMTAPYAPPTAVTDMYLGRLPYVAAQNALAAQGVVLGTTQAAGLGWHGTLTDVETGSFCLVQTDGTLADLVGERLRISVGGRSVCAYCIRTADIIEDISVTRHLFAQLAPLATDELAVTVEIMGAGT